MQEQQASVSQTGRRPLDCPAGRHLPGHLHRTREFAGPGFRGRVESDLPAAGLHILRYEHTDVHSNRHSDVDAHSNGDTDRYPGSDAMLVDDVSGFYEVQYSNIQHDCPFPISDPPLDNIEIVQNETDLTLCSDAGDATGTIDPQTGAFQVVATSTSPPCILGCVNATTGTFRLGQNPMTFTGTGQIDVLTIGGGVSCTVTYDVEGTRTSCAGAAITSSSTAIVTSSCRPLPGT